MNNLIDSINETVAQLQNELEKSMTNSAAAQRARKLTLALASLMKAFRAESVAFHKKA